MYNLMVDGTAYCVGHLLDRESKQFDHVVFFSLVYMQISVTWEADSPEYQLDI